MQMLPAFQKLRDFQAGFEDAANCLRETIGTNVCLSGCGKCCEITVPLSMTLEAMLAVSMLTGIGKLSKTVSIAEGWLLEHHKEAPSYEGEISSWRFLTGNLKDEFDKLKVSQCPFLSETKSCLIYEVRPLVCRAYGITRTPDAWLCPRPAGIRETATQKIYINVPELNAEYIALKRTLAKENPAWLLFGFFPTLLYRAAEEKKFREMVRDNKVATAKIVGSDLDTTLMWQAQVELLNAGVAPDLVAHGNPN